MSQPEPPPKPPLISVIIATYNWSSALRLAIESVLQQTFSDFEVLVVGDACSDDSAQVVASFGDSRLHWHNLPTNCGSQWGPNNYALSVAQGELVAYLGHDDLWWPTHLELALATYRQTGADIVAAGALLYGPVGSGTRALLGFFPNGTYSRRHFVPPSAMLHRTALAARVGGWRSSEEALVAVDIDFLVRCFEAGAVVVPTATVTVFKFPAAWRRSAYQTRDASEQRVLLSRMRQEGESMLVAELTSAVHAAAVDLLVKIEVDPASQSKAEESASMVRVFKGKDPHPSAMEPIVIQGKRRYLPPPGFYGLEWHPLEQHEDLGSYRWSGPATTSSVVLPEKIDRPLEVTLQVLNWVTEATLKTARVHINDVDCNVKIVQLPTGGIGLRGDIHPNLLPLEDRAQMRITITLEKTWRPFDVGLSADRRWLGLAIGWIEIS